MLKLCSISRSQIPLNVSYPQIIISSFDTLTIELSVNKNGSLCPQTGGESGAEPSALTTFAFQNSQRHSYIERADDEEWVKGLT
jgi:hypothetical protein